MLGIKLQPTKTKAFPLNTEKPVEFEGKFESLIKMNHDMCLLSVSTVQEMGVIALKRILSYYSLFVMFIFPSPNTFLESVLWILHLLSSFLLKIHICPLLYSPYPGLQYSLS